jgi:glycosyltransferase involved in cell wall biosynthesis
VCQSEEIKTHIASKHNIAGEKLIVIPNPVVFNNESRIPKHDNNIKRLIVVARLTSQKGIFRLLDIMEDLPASYHLSIVGDGVLRQEIANKIDILNLSQRVKMLGMIRNVTEVISGNDLFVLPSFIEGFPNVVLESLSVGTPVVSFEVGGISDIIVEDFNGYIVKQNDLKAFREKVLLACERSWDTESIRNDIFEKFSLEKITEKYQSLVVNKSNS